MGIAVADIGIVGVELQRALELLLRSRKIPLIVQLGQSQCAVAVRQTLVFLYRQACRLLHLAPALAWRYRAKESQKKVSLRHMCVGRRVVWIELNRLIVVVDALLQIETVEIGIRPQVIVVRLRVYLFHLRYRSWFGPT